MCAVANLRVEDMKKCLQISDEQGRNSIHLEIITEIVTKIIENLYFFQDDFQDTSLCY